MRGFDFYTKGKSVEFMSETIEKSYYAHTKEGQPPVEWQPLEDHLKRVAELARSFADEFGAGEWGYLAGLWHDLGKYSKEFQKYLLSTPSYKKNGIPCYIL